MVRAPLTPHSSRSDLIGLVPQDIALYPFLTARENLAIFAQYLSIPKAEQIDAINLALTHVDMGHKADTRVEHMSGGMKRRINVAAAIMHNPALLILDEPTAGVDTPARDAIHGLLRKLAESGMAIILVTHELDEVEHYCDHILFLAGGVLLAHATGTQILAHTFGENREIIVDLAQAPTPEHQQILLNHSLEEGPVPTRWQLFTHVNNQEYLISLITTTEQLQSLKKQGHSLNDNLKMIRAIFKTMWLRLWRDKGALILAFILPGFIFAVFASIFSNAAGGSLDIRVAMAVVSEDIAVHDFAKDLRDSADYSVTFDTKFTEETIRERIALGTEDVGLIIHNAPSPVQVTPPFTLITEPSRDVAATILQGQVRQYLSDQNPLNSQAKIFTLQSALDSQEVSGPKDPSVTYYVGGVAILFLLFSAMQGAAITLEERRMGISDRILPGPDRVMKMIIGKFMFLTLIGTIQAILIVIVAILFFDVSVSGHIIGITLACLGAASLAASIGLLTASLCTSPAQMNTVSTFVVLLCSAIGGSMVPRFMMPDWLQGLGRFTPNHWAIEAMYGAHAHSYSLS